MRIISCLTRRDVESTTLFALRVIGMNEQMTLEPLRTSSPTLQTCSQAQQARAQVAAAVVEELLVLMDGAPASNARMRKASSEMSSRRYVS